VFRNFWKENARRDVACNVSLTAEVNAEVRRGQVGCNGERDVISYVSTRELAWVRAGRRRHTGLETHHYRLGLKPYAPDFFDALLDLLFQGQHLGGGGAPAIHDGESVFA
jgi:hypothetical protein